MNKLSTFERTCFHGWEGILEDYDVTEIFNELLDHPFHAATDATSLLLDENYNTDDLFEYEIKGVLK